MPILSDRKIDPRPLKKFAEDNRITPSPDDDETSRAAFPIAALPATLARFVTECARVAQVPQELPAACCLAVVSAALGSRLRTRSIAGKTTPANIMVFAAADTGSGKSETHRECMAPFEQCQQQQQRRWRDDVLPSARAEVRLLSKEMKTLENKAGGASTNRDKLKRELAAAEAQKALAESQCLPPVYRASDFTTPELIRLLCRMEGQMFATSPDAKNFVDQVLGRYNEGGTDEEAYLKGFSLEPIDRQRVGDGSQETPEACITGLWLTQPDKLARLLAERSLSEGGLLPRLLIMQTHCQPLRVYLSEDGIAADARESYRALIVELFYAFRVGEGARITSADPAARKALADFHNSVADRRGGELRDVTGFAARWGEYAWRLALVVHAARHGRDAGDHAISLKDAQAGIALARWFNVQQLAILEAGRAVAKRAKFEEALRLFVDDSTVVVARDVYRANITPRNDTALAAALLDEMEAAGLLKHEDRPTKRVNHVQRAYRLKSKTGKPSRTLRT